MAFVGVSQYNHNQQIDEYEYDDTENFYDDGGNYGNYLEVDDSEGECAIDEPNHKHKIHSIFDTVPCRYRGS